MPYNIVQSVFLMNQAANGVSDVYGSQAYLVQTMTTYLNGGSIGGTQFPGFFNDFKTQLAGGDWRVVWGPCVYIETQPSDFATNAMYVAYSPSQNTYVVAVAPTNFLSLQDWIQQDGNVAYQDMATWPLTLPYVSPNNNQPPTVAAVSGATAQGVSNLLTTPGMVDPNKGSLRTYLASLNKANATLIFTGHSLAGALTPALALTLYPSPTTSGWKQVLVLPTAGATPGNLAWANLYDNTYKSVSTGFTKYAFWNADYANEHDIVPRAWNNLMSVVSETPIIKYPDMYYSSIYSALSLSIGVTLANLVKNATQMAAASGYIHITHLPFSHIWGYWDYTPNGNATYPPVWSSMPYYMPAHPMNSVDVFADYVDRCHMDQYVKYFDVVPPRPLPASVTAAQDPTGRAARRRALLLAGRLGRSG